MTRVFPAEMVIALHKSVHDAEANGTLLDAYAVAEQLQRQSPENVITISETVDYLILPHVENRAIEFYRAHPEIPAIAPDVREEPLWKPWAWLTDKADLEMATAITRAAAPIISPKD